MTGSVLGNRVVGKEGPTFITAGAEEVRFDEDGDPVTSNLADYAMISADEPPSFEVV